MPATPFELLERVRQQQPLVHHLTNWVTIYDCAQVVKSLGGSPLMAHAPEEMVDMAGIASALVLNIGTLTVELVEAMKLAAVAANRRGIPVLLDACGAGASHLRDESCLELLQSARLNLIKGNASEVARLAGASVKSRGVDVAEVQADVAGLATQLARHYQATVVVTGPVDIVTNGRLSYRISNGHPLMTRVVGTGCMAASVIATFAAVEPDLSLAAAAGLVCYEVAAELAAAQSAGPMAFKQKLFDCLYQLDGPTLEGRQRIELLG